MQYWRFPALLVVASFLLLSCRPSLSVGESPLKQDSDCRNLETRLHGLVSASDREAYAKAQDLDYKNGKVLVVIELKDAGQTLPGGYDITEQSRQGNLIQAFVRVDQLCSLAAESQISRIRSPAIPAPMT